MTAGQRVECQHLISSTTFISNEWLEKKDEKEKRVLRSILISCGSLLPDSQKEHISLVNLSGIEPSSGARLQEAGWEACLAERGYFVGQLTAVANPESRQLVEDLVERWYETEKKEDEEKEEGSEEGKMEKDDGEGLRKNDDDKTEGKKKEENIEMNKKKDEPTKPVLIRRVQFELEQAKLLFGKFWSDRDFLPRALQKSEEDEERKNEFGDEKEVEAKEESKENEREQQD